jgi:hypothetical protein
MSETQARQEVTAPTTAGTEPTAPYVDVTDQGHLPSQLILTAIEHVRATTAHEAPVQVPTISVTEPAPASDPAPTGPPAPAGPSDVPAVPPKDSEPAMKSILKSFTQPTTAKPADQMVPTPIDPQTGVAKPHENFTPTENFGLVGQQAKAKLSRFFCCGDDNNIQS